MLIGIKGAWRRGSTFDKSSLYGSLALYSMPEGWLGMLLLLFFGGTVFHLFPSGGYRSPGLEGVEYFTDIAKHLFLPVLTLTLGYIGEYAIIMRASLRGDDERGLRADGARQGRAGPARSVAVTPSRTRSCPRSP